MEMVKFNEVSSERTLCLVIIDYMAVWWTSFGLRLLSIMHDWRRGVGDFGEGIEALIYRVCGSLEARVTHFHLISLCLGYITSICQVTSDCFFAHCSLIHHHSDLSCLAAFRFIPIVSFRLLNSAALMGLFPSFCSDSFPCYVCVLPVHSLRNDI